jgi:hypothetical protein
MYKCRLITINEDFGMGDAGLIKKINIDDKVVQL